VASWRKGRVLEILERHKDLVRAVCDIDGDHIEAVAFPHMVGPLEADQWVILNTTGLDLDLGTGGVAFVLWNLDERVLPEAGEGHIVKLRYTPWQTEVLAAEAPESPHHDELAKVDNIGGMPVVACGLHSQLAGAAAGIKAFAPDARVGYLMTDAAALPIAWSGLVRELVQAGVVDVTCTAGHALGGDLEAVNVFSALAALRVAGSADALVAAMGPGVVGTATTLGFTAIEQGQILDAVNALGGSAIASLRVSFSDSRRRHFGVSHHTLTALGLAARDRATVVVPELPPTEDKQVREDLERAGIPARHNVINRDGEPGLKLLSERGIHPSSMGRSVQDAPELFLAAAAAGRCAAEAL
jgi:hypothetical protein